MRTAFLYGRNAHLAPIYRSGAPVRFTDLYHYVRLENENIRDDERIRRFQFEPKVIKRLTVGSRDIASDLIGPVTIGLPTERCHVLCLSKTGFHPALYAHFKADLCIEIHVDRFVSLLRTELAQWNINVVTGDVVYCGINSSNLSTHARELVFLKDERYRIENEYRIALFYPVKNPVLNGVNGPVKMFGDQHFIEIGFLSPWGAKGLVQGARDASGRSLFGRPSRKAPSELSHIRQVPSRGKPARN